MISASEAVAAAFADELEKLGSWRDYVGLPRMSGGIVTPGGSMSGSQPPPFPEQPPIAGAFEFDTPRQSRLRAHYAERDIPPPPMADGWMNPADHISGNRRSYKADLSDEMVQRVREMARQAATRHGIDVDTFERQMFQESKFNPLARSHRGALGVAQLMPGTARDLGVLGDDFDFREDPRASIDAGARYMKKNLSTFGTMPKALAAYNWGPGNVKEFLAKGRTLDQLPDEPRKYIKKVLP